MRRATVALISVSLLGFAFGCATEPVPEPDAPPQIPFGNGANRDVAITVDSEPTTGTMFLVMLHLDVNEDQQFDFVFVDERNVLDEAVFEGTTMIGHAIETL